MYTLKFTWVFASILLLFTFTLFPIATCHLPLCSFEGINLEKCMDPDKNQASFDSCCNALNQVIQAGYYCLCAILGSSSPLITNSLVLPFSNCFISIPPLTHCQEPKAKVSPVQEMRPPPSRPIPIFWHPKSPNEPPPLPLPSVPKDLVLPLPPNMDDIPVLNSARHDNVTIYSLFPEFKNPMAGYLTSLGGDSKKILLYAKVHLLLIVTTFYVMLMN
ncbi:hypothetical protein R3W88_007311 [Solanum pinnatisectum]|uniref:Bifunctional inhibitor/plant lipid transfer protein/seed storage helical domain-containing protein n=1 Tax=Solanum pinnatisectum TaxID=50273 RepID=A0AAV9M7U8_9SOLN|nr:hypothetical protein R3W88_007311 [Solanum pinnatisectum]